MAQKKGKGRGWHGEKRRHQLAGAGYKTVLPDGRRLDVSKFVAHGESKIKSDEMTISVGGKEFRVLSRKTGLVMGFPNSDDRLPHYKFAITVVNEDGARVNFPFYGSAYDAERHKRNMDEGDLVDVLTTFFDEAISGTYAFDEMCDEFGYDCIDPDERRRAKRIHRELQKMNERAMDLGLSEDELYEIVNELRERV